MLTQEYVKNRMYYNEIEGTLHWKVDLPSAKVIKGDLVGWVNIHGYRVTELFYKEYYLCKLVWLFHKGYLPDKLDHINNIRTDDRIENLREVSFAQNNWNRKKASNNTSGIKGLSINKACLEDRWYCKVVKNGKRYDKYFKISEKEEAIKWLKDLRELLHGEYTNHG